MTTKISTDNTSGAITSSGGGIALPATLPASGATLITDASSQYVSQTASPFMRNRIINGAQMINQRYFDAPVTPGASTYVNDRWLCYSNFASGTFLSNRCAGWSNYFDGNGDYLSAPASTAYDFGTGDFTIEAWVYITANSAVDPGGNRVAAVVGSYNNAGQGWYFSVWGNGTTTGNGLGIEVQNSGVYASSVPGCSISQQAWHHIAATRQSGILRFFLDGVQQGSDVSFTDALSGGSASLWISRLNATSYDRYFNGYISNLRIVKGTALYTANFTPSTLPLVRVANTSLLTCASEKSQDQSANNFPILVVGNTTVTTSSPFTNVAPSGFASGLRWSVLTPASAGVADRATMVQRIEGSSVSDLAWGTASAKSVTVSFWVRSPLIGTYCVSLANNGGVLSYVAEYSVSVANTWEKKSIQIQGPTSGTFATDNNNSFSLRFNVTSGSASATSATGIWQAGDYTCTPNQTDFVGTALASGAQSNDFIITGVQLELGSVATPFEFRPMQAEVALCQRYFARLASLSGTYVGFGVGVSSSATVAYAFVPYPVTMRATPSNVTQSNTCLFDTVARPVTSVTGLYRGLNGMGIVLTASGGGMTTNRSVIWCGNNNARAYVDIDAEL